MYLLRKTCIHKSLIFHNYIFQLRFHAREISPWHGSLVLLQEQWGCPLYSVWLLELNLYQVSLLSSHIVSTLSHLTLMSYMPASTWIYFSRATLCFICSHLSVSQVKAHLLIILLPFLGPPLLPPSLMVPDILFTSIVRIQLAFLP